MTRQAQKDEELDRLSRLGFGVAGELMTESRVLLDTGFQGPFFRELDEKLGETLASHIRAQVGLFHGLRDGIAALGSMRSEFQQKPPTTYPAVPIQFQSFENHSEISIGGYWIDAAEARVESSRAAKQKGCPLTSGYVSGWLSGLMEKELAAFEIACKSTGAERCRFVARETNAWRSENDGEKDAVLDALPFALFRRTLEGLANEPERPSQRVDPSMASAAHIWGPVMILPISDPEETLRNTKAITLRGEHKKIQAVVVNFATPRTCHAKTVSRIEAILDTVTSWGAEPVLAHAPENLISTLEAMAIGPYLAHETLEQAVASAFQIVQTQKHLL